MSAKKNVHVPLRYDKIKTKKVGKKEKSKRKGIKLKKERKKERKKEDSRLSEIEIIQYIFFTFIYHYKIVVLESDPSFYICFHRLSYCIAHF